MNTHSVNETKVMLTGKWEVNERLAAEILKSKGHRCMEKSFDLEYETRMNIGSFEAIDTRSKYYYCLGKL